uniref:Uncharacterized protein n=1 Tax=Candidatus Kentrum sp. TC TaxID=2126339 RepID=A0A450YMJ1_9GAMM|nr:MAG: hypothetical protein BECKTC1821E_GA0114239_10219 [Candidatus Kentron sp. TC]
MNLFLLHPTDGASEFVEAVLEPLLPGFQAIYLSTQGFTSLLSADHFLLELPDSGLNISHLFEARARLLETCVGCCPIVGGFSTTSVIPSARRRRILLSIAARSASRRNENVQSSAHPSGEELHGR